MPRLLVIEDDVDTRELLAILLESAGYQVTAVAREAEAVRALELGGFDLVVADLLIDRGTVPDAWAYIERIVAAARPTPIGLITGWNIGAAAVGHLAFVIRKPYSADVLFARLGDTLRLPPLSAETVESVHDYFRCLEAGGSYERFRTLLAPDVVYRLPGADARFANEIRGLDEFIAFTARTFEALASPTFEIETLRPLPQGALVQYVGRWRQGGVEHAMPGAVIFQFAGDRILRVDVRVNTDQLR